MTKYGNSEADCFPLDEILFSSPDYSRFADREEPDLIGESLAQFEAMASEEEGD